MGDVTLPSTKGDMRVYLTTSELAIDAGKQLLDLAVRIAADGLIELSEIEELHSWVERNKGNDKIVAITYLDGILRRVKADGMIDSDELVELHLAIERVIPAAHRTPIIKARKLRESEERQRQKAERQAGEREKKLEEQKRQAEEYARQRRLRHVFAKVAGVTFQNDDGSERQRILKKCRIGEQLFLRHDVDNEYSDYALQVLRENSEQLGFVPEYLVRQIHDERDDGYRTIGVLKDLTGGTRDKPTRGANFFVVFMARDVTDRELQDYIDGVFGSDDRRGQNSFDWKSVSLTTPVRRKPWWKFW